MAALLALAVASPAQAVTVDEGASDAGASLANALEVKGRNTLDAITGQISSAADQDVYQICVRGGGGFSATTVGDTNSLDTQLFLLDDAGRAVYGNDDSSFSTVKSRLPANHALTPDRSGVHHLVVSGYNDDPATATGAALFTNGSRATVVGPVSPTATFGGWKETNGSRGAYRVRLTGAEECASDTTPPTVKLTQPTDGAEYVLGSAVTADYECRDEEGGSGLKSCGGSLDDGDALDTGTVGLKTFTVRAEDNAGNVERVRVEYRVVYAFSGPLRPLGPGENVRNAGANVPFRFSLAGYRGADVLERVESRDADCEPDAAEPRARDEARGRKPERRAKAASYEDADVGRLTYSEGSDTYHFNWKTERAWEGTCRLLLVELDDGKVRRFTFRFR